LPTIASAVAPVQASTAASIAAQVRQAAVGGRAVGVGVVATIAAPRSRTRERRVELGVVEGAVERDDDDVGLVGLRCDREALVGEAGPRTASSAISISVRPAWCSPRLGDERVDGRHDVPGTVSMPSAVSFAA